MKLTNLFLVVVILLLIVSLGGNIYLLYDKNTMQQQYDRQAEIIRRSVESQKRDKDTIRSLWENQALLNDKLIAEQQDMIFQVNQYFEEIDRSIRFVNTVPNVLSTISEYELNTKRNNLKQKIENIIKVREENSAQKSKNKDKIDEIYKNAGEDQPRTANPVDGIRE